MSRHVLVTGAAGYIGFHVARRLLALAEGDRVTGVDSLNDYFDPRLKKDRLAEIEDEDGFEFHELDLADVPATPDESWEPEDPEIGRSSAPFRIYNIGNGAPVDLMELIGPLEEKLGRETEKNFMPMQPGDVRETWASVDGLREADSYEPSTPLEEGLEEFVDWYRAYHDASRAS